MFIGKMTCARVLGSRSETQSLPCAQSANGLGWKWFLGPVLRWTSTRSADHQTACVLGPTQAHCCLVPFPPPPLHRTLSVHRASVQIRHFLEEVQVVQEKETKNLITPSLSETSWPVHGNSNSEREGRRSDAWR